MTAWNLLVEIKAGLTAQPLLFLLINNPTGHPLSPMVVPKGVNQV